MSILSALFFTSLVLYQLGHIHLFCICISVPDQFTSTSGVGLYFEGWVLGQLEFWIFTD